MSRLEFEQGPWREGGGGKHLRCQDLIPKDATGSVGTKAEPMGSKKSGGLGEPGLAVPSASCPQAEFALSEAPPPLGLGNAALGSDRPGFWSWYRHFSGKKFHLSWHQ